MARVLACGSDPLVGRDWIRRRAPHEIASDTVPVRIESKGPGPGAMDIPEAQGTHRFSPISVRVAVFC